MFQPIDKSEHEALVEKKKSLLRDYADLWQTIRDYRKFVSVLNRPWVILHLPQKRSTEWQVFRAHTSFRSAYLSIFKYSKGRFEHKQYCIINIKDLTYFDKKHLDACEAMGWDSLRVQRAANGLVK